MKLAFEAEMIVDGVDVNVIDPQGKGERGHPNGDRSPYELVYKWLWEKKFPREGWKLAKKIAIYGGERLKMKLISDSERKPNLDEIPAVEDGFIKRNQRYRLHVTPSEKGNLLLINEDNKGWKGLICPSRAYARVPYVELEPSESIQLPPPDGSEDCAESLKYNDIRYGVFFCYHYFGTAKIVLD